MKIDTRDIINVTDASNMGVSKLIQEAGDGRNRVVVRNGRPAAAVVSIETVEQLERLEEAEENLRLQAVAIARTITDDGTRHELDDVAAEFGIDLDGLDDED